jgi:Tat protein translocase TatB subunit
MPQIGPLEILIVSVIALIVFGPEKLPGMARSIGRTLSDLRHAASEVRSEFTAGLDDDDEPVRSDVEILPPEKPAVPPEEPTEEPEKPV